MADARTRDKVWMVILANIRRGNEVTVKEVQEATGCAERTARDVLNVAADNAMLLTVDVKQHNKRVYRPDVKLEQRNLLD